MTHLKIPVFPSKIPTAIPNMMMSALLCSSGNKRKVKSIYSSQPWSCSSHEDVKIFVRFQNNLNVNDLCFCRSTPTFKGNTHHYEHPGRLEKRYMNASPFPFPTYNETYKICIYIWIQVIIQWLSWAHLRWNWPACGPWTKMNLTPVIYNNVKTE